MVKCEMVIFTFFIAVLVGVILFASGFGVAIKLIGFILLVLIIFSNRKRIRTIQFIRFIFFGLSLGSISGFFLGNTQVVIGDLCSGIVTAEYSRGLGISVVHCDTDTATRGVVYAYCEGNGCPGMYTTVRLRLDKPGFGPFIASGKIFERWGLQLPSGIKSLYFEIMSKGAGYRGNFYNKVRMLSSPDVSGLGVSILFGETGLTDDFKTSVRELGLLHIVAISGINIVYLQQLIGYLTRSLRSDITEKIDLMLLVYLYVLVGNNISLIRAIGVMLLKLIFKKSGAEYKPEYFLFVLSFMVVLSPSIIKNVSFWLVFAVCIGIYVISPAIKKKIRISNSFALTIIESGVVWLAVFPVVITVFERVAPMSILYGIMLDPILEVATMIGYVAFFVTKVPVFGNMVLRIYVVLISVIVNAMYMFHGDI